MTKQPLRPTQPDELPAPLLDELSVTVVTKAVDTLAALRTPYWLGDNAIGQHAWPASSNRPSR
jgi:hypothetical protein